jgi:hypothetical protein
VRSDDVKAEKNHIVFDYNDDTLTIRVNGKLVTAYRKPDIGHEYLKSILDDLRRLIESHEEHKELYVLRFKMPPPSVGACTLCSRHANLLGGLCFPCSELTDE